MKAGTKRGLALVFILVLWGFAGWCLVDASNRQSMKASVVCRNHLKQLFLTMAIYADEHEGALPPMDLQHPTSIRPLLELEDILDAPFHCPAYENGTSTDSGYYFVGRGISVDDPDARIKPLFIEDPANHDGKWQNILYADGHVEQRELK